MSRVVLLVACVALACVVAVSGQEGAPCAFSTLSGVCSAGPCPGGFRFTGRCQGGPSVQCCVQEDQSAMSEPVVSAGPQKPLRPARPPPLPKQSLASAANAKPTRNKVGSADRKVCANNTYRTLLLEDINKLRKAKGAPALKLDDVLNRAARQHVFVMLKAKKAFSVGDHAKLVSGSALVAENVARTAERDYEQIKQLVQWNWAKNPAMLKNMLNPAFKYLGVDTEGEREGARPASWDEPDGNDSGSLVEYTSAIFSDKPGKPTPLLKTDCW